MRTSGQAVASVVASGQPAETPPAEDVTAGTWGLVVFLLLVAATVVLMRSFLKQMRKTEQARRSGVFGDEAAGPRDHEDDPGAEGR